MDKKILFSGVFILLLLTIGFFVPYFYWRMLSILQQHIFMGGIVIFLFSFGIYVLNKEGGHGELLIGMRNKLFGK